MTKPAFRQHDLRRAIAALCLCAAPAFADGPSAPIMEDRPCDAPLVTWEAFQASWVGDGAADGYRLAQRLWDARCAPDTPLATDWQARGWTDAELLAAVFNGHDVPDQPAQVPLPWSGLMLAAALVMLREWARYVRGEA